MDFTRDELLLMSEGIIKLIQDASKAMELVSYDEAQKHIKVHIDDLRELNGKICKAAEDALPFH